MSYVTGYCATGACEGTQPVSASGEPRKVCTAIDICTCECHQKITDIFEQTGMQRTAFANPQYEPAHNVDLTWLADPPVKEIPYVYTPPMTPVLTIPSLSVPASGQQSAIPVTGNPWLDGIPEGLERQVLRVCHAFFVRELPNEVEFLTVQQIQNLTGLPSRGGIGACLDRWQNIGFAIISDSRPRYFVSFTKDGLQKGLLRMKQEARKKR